MSNNDLNKELPKMDGDESKPASEVIQKPYHTPVFVHYGALAELVQNNPTPGPDGGTLADCTHN